MTIAAAAKPYTFVDGASNYIRAAEVNSDFDTAYSKINEIVTEVNGHTSGSVTVGNAAKLGGYSYATTATASTVPVRDASGKLAGDILGNAATCTTASGVATGAVASTDAFAAGAAATTTAKGVIELATSVETIAGTLSTVVPTVASVKLAYDTWIATTFSGRRFQSTAITYAASTTFSFSHGLASVPVRTWVAAKCISAEKGYSVNDWLNNIMVSDGGEEGPVTTKANATTVSFTTSSAIFAVNATNKLIETLDPAKWEFYLFAEI